MLCHLGPLGVSACHSDLCVVLSPSSIQSLSKNEPRHSRPRPAPRPARPCASLHPTPRPPTPPAGLGILPDAHLAGSSSDTTLCAPLSCHHPATLVFLPAVEFANTLPPPWALHAPSEILPPPPGLCCTCPSRPARGKHTRPLRRCQPPLSRGPRAHAALLTAVFFLFPRRQELAHYCIPTRALEL